MVGKSAHRGQPKHSKAIHVGVEADLAEPESPTDGFIGEGFENLTPERIHKMPTADHRFAPVSDQVELRRTIMRRHHLPDGLSASLQLLRHTHAPTSHRARDKPERPGGGRVVMTRGV